MVTQSAGPYTAVGMGMALAAWQVRDKGAAEQDAFLQQAAYDLAHARPTTANRYGQITYRCAEVAKEALTAGKDPVEAIVENTVESLNRRYSTMQIVGDHLAELIPQGGTILTQCFGETIIGTVIRAARRQSKDFKVFCAETRPYLQGARLTSGCFAQMGFDTTVITDNMVAYAILSVMTVVVKNPHLGEAAGGRPGALPEWPGLGAEHLENPLLWRRPDDGADDGRSPQSTGVKIVPPSGSLRQMVAHDLHGGCRRLGFHRPVVHDSTPLHHALLGHLSAAVGEMWP